ncbi:sensor domain-containing protein [Lysobacter sp. A378]
MKRKPPARSPSAPLGPLDASAVLMALDQAGQDTTLSPALATVLQQARAALQQSLGNEASAQQRYRALFDAMPDPISIIAWDGTVLDLNKAGVAAYQRPRDEIVGQPIDLLNPDLPPGHMGPVHDALARGQSYVIEVTNRRADGSRFPVEVHSANFEYDGQRCLVAVARDLSARVDAEVRFRELTEMVDKGIVVRNADGHTTYANAAAIRLMDAEQSTSIDEVFKDGRWLMVDESGKALPDNALPSSRALATGKPVGPEVIGFFNQRRHELIWLSVIAVPQFVAGADKPHQALSVFHDVTALKRDSTLFERAQALAHIGGWQWDTGRNHLYLTNEAQRIIGRDPAPDTMEGLLDCLVESDHRRLRQALDQTMESRQGLQLELQGRRGDGHQFWIRVIGEAQVASPLSATLTGTVQDITEDKQDEETLRVEARTDPLTGLLNRDALRIEIEARLGDSCQSALAVLYIDLDRFKVVNDVLGHAAGDRLLSSAARRIQRAVGTEGLIARFGGDEFLVLCSLEDDPARPARLADRILEIFADAFRMDGEEFAITASIGIAQSPQDGGHAQQLIKNADVAMYASKRRGRNSWQVFSPELAAEQQHRQQLETQLRHAIDNDEFRLVYQPQVDLASGRLIAVEALIRWNNELLGEIQPDHFISHAETTGDIIGIGSWVIRQACWQLGQWRSRGLEINRVAVNVSYRQFLGKDLATAVEAVLLEFGLPGSALELEFTERVLIEDEPDTQHAFAALREMGVTLTIDDFGEGYSALNYLRRLPIHGLKLSQVFVQGIPGNASDVAVCEAVIGIARSLGLELVAEGVETPEQRDFLIKLGVSVGQGFLFAEGLSPEALEDMYASAAVPAK